MQVTVVMGVEGDGVRDPWGLRENLCDHVTKRTEAVSIGGGVGWTSDGKTFADEQFDLPDEQRAEMDEAVREWLSSEGFVVVDGEYADHGGALGEALDDSTPERLEPGQATVTFR